MGMTIIYTDHAKERMLIRGISEKMVEEALSSPDKQGEERGRKVVFKNLETGIIKVVYVQEQLFIIITTIWHKKYEN